jgi:hypothetical protein
LNQKGIKQQNNSQKSNTENVKSLLDTFFQKRKPVLKEKTGMIREWLIKESEKI